jgi:adenylate cyclase
VESVKGKIVLVGSRLAMQKDFFSTPFSRFSDETEEFKDKFGTVIGDLLGDREPGVACHAHAVETILSQSFIGRVSTLWVAVLIVALGLVGLLFYVLRIGIVFETLLEIAMLAAIAGVSHLVFLEKLLWLDIAPLFSILLTQFVVGAALQKTFERKRIALITNLFGKYVSPKVVSVVIKSDINDTLEGHGQELTVLFSDLRGFTTLSERLGPKDTGILLNNYFDAMIPIVFKHQGTLDKLMGDAVMAFFGAPIAVPDHPAKAAKTALKMVEKLDTLRSLEIAGMENLQIGIGLNTGVATVGNLGSRQFMDYTIIGDAVNLTSRLEGINKVYGTNIILSEFTAKKLDSRFLLRNLDKVKVKGKDKVVTIFELVGFRDSVEEKRFELVRVFESGLAAYRKMEWDHADECFSRALALFPADGPSRLYRERIIYLRQNPPQEGWNGVKTFDHK